MSSGARAAEGAARAHGGAVNLAMDEVLHAACPRPGPIMAIIGPATRSDFPKAANQEEQGDPRR